jgi:hypothetical protein
VQGLPERYGFADLDWITWAPPLDHLAPTPQLRRLIPGFRPAFAADDFLVQFQAAEAGVGVLFMGQARHSFMLPTTLVKLPLDLPLSGSELHLIAARTAMEILRVKSVAERLVREMARVDTGAVTSRSAASTRSSLHHRVPTPRARRALGPCSRFRHQPAIPPGKRYTSG